MSYLETFVGLLAKTSSRDSLLRLVQYLTLHSEDHAVKGPTNNIYIQMRRTRKILRFLRTLEHSAQIRKQVTALIKEPLPAAHLTAYKILLILEHLFTVLFYLFDHRVFLGELGVISKEQLTTYYPRSMKMYRLQNIFGALKTIAEVVVIFLEGTYQGQIIDMDDAQKILRSKLAVLIKNILDIFVANYYLNKPAGCASRIGVIGTITSLISIVQALKLI